MKTLATVTVTGLRELQESFRELPKATARAVLKRVLTKRAMPLADAMRSKAPDDPSTHGQDLRGSIGVSGRLSKRQGAMHRRETRDQRDFAEVFAGAGALPQAHLSEYGGPNNSPASWGRSSWDGEKGTIVDGIAGDIWDEIRKTAQRRAARLARIAAKR